jgi:hypothetical protein
VILGIYGVALAVYAGLGHVRSINDPRICVRR